MSPGPGAARRGAAPAGTPGDAMFEVEALDAGYGALQILFGVSLGVSAGEQLLVFGPNGAGKSTLMKALVGLAGVSAGHVRLRGRELTGLPTETVVGHGIGYVPQVSNVFGSMSVEENLEMGGARLGRRAAGRMRELYELFPLLAERRRQAARTLSGGQRQVLAMARALMPAPELLLLDEPSAGLSPGMVRFIFETVSAIARTGTAVLMVEQNARQALAYVDRGVVLENGRVRFHGEAGRLLEREDIGALYLGVQRER